MLHCVLGLLLPDMPTGTRTFILMFTPVYPGSQRGSIRCGSTPYPPMLEGSSRREWPNGPTLGYPSQELLQELRTRASTVSLVWYIRPEIQEAQSGEHESVGGPSLR